MAWNTALDLALERRETAEPAALAAAWRTERASAPPFRAMILDHWLAWAEGPALQPLDPWRARVSVLSWCGVPIVALPGEIFATTALEIRAGIGRGLPSWPPIAKGTPATSHPAANTPSEATKSTRRIAITACRPPSRPGSAEALAAAALALRREDC